jgi:hypothetical protein
MRFDVTGLRGYELSVLAMPRGEHTLEEIDTSESVAFVLLFGCVQVTRQRSGEPASFSLHATPQAPLFLVNPGTYCVVARSNTLGFRGSRRKAVAP